MTPSEEKFTHNLSKLIRVSRKEFGISQIDLAQKMDLSQSAISKIENGSLMPSALQWLAFCEMVKIDPNSLVQGYIDREENAGFERKKNLNFKVPVGYLDHPGSNVRGIKGFSSLLDYSVGKGAFSSFCVENKIDPDYFVCLDNRINFDFTLRLVDSILLKSKKSFDINKILREDLLSKDLHGNFASDYQKEVRPLERLQSLFKKQKKYEVNFRYNIEEIKSNEAHVTIDADPSLISFANRLKPESELFLDNYRKNFLTGFCNSKREGGPVTVTNLGRPKILGKCTYKLSFKGLSGE